MTLETFIDTNRLRRKRDDCGDLNAMGKRGTIYAYSADLMAATIMGTPTAQHWNTYRAAFIAASCRIIQNGDAEGTALFDPENVEQARVALKAIKAIRRRLLSPEEREAKIKILSAANTLRRKTHFDHPGVVSPVRKPSDEI